MCLQAQCATTSTIMATPKSAPKKSNSPDFQYRTLLKEILEKGERRETQQGVDTISLIGATPMRFKLANGFPLITERNMAPEFKNGKPTVWQAAIAEITAFINGARTQEELSQFGCYWWEPWVTEAKCHKRGLETGDLGPGSYGAAFHDFPTAEGETFNQFAVCTLPVSSSCTPLSVPITKPLGANN